MGADYNAGRRNIIGGMERAGLAANVTVYLCPWGGDDWAAIGQVDIPFAIAGIIDHLWYETSVPPGAGETFTITIMVNGIASVVTCQIAGAVANAAQDLINAAAIAVGDTVGIRIATSLNAAVGTHRWSFRFRPT